ncbi:MAG: NAD-dependent deacylase [Muribaculaceae bacterium]|nr:NAD-dependent deacylase [Muribaculaceae bacterium]
MKKIVVSTGAGVSAESGMPTYRDAGGLWENYPVMEVASDQGFARNPELIHRFYNNMRKKLTDQIKPNAAHLGLAAMESDYDMRIITQNVDNLHERAGSTKVLHLHGELMKVRSVNHPERVYELPSDELTDKGLETSPQTRDRYGDGVRPHIVFFGESVPNFEPAALLAREADVFVIIGTSLVVYPAAGLLSYVRRGVPVYYIDPNPVAVPSFVNVIAEPATRGVAELARLLNGQ